MNDYAEVRKLWVKSGLTPSPGDSKELVRAKLGRDPELFLVAVEDGEKALTTVKDTGIAIDVVVTDIVLPKASGMEVIEAVHSCRPNIGVVVTSGYTRNERDSMEIIVLADRFLEKPFTGAQLLSAVRQLL